MLALSLSHLSMRVRVRGQLSFIPCVCVCVRVNALARTSALTHWYFLFSPLLRSMFVAIVLAVNSLKYVIHTHTRIQRRNQQQYKRNGMVFARSHIWWVLYGTGKCVCVCAASFSMCVYCRAKECCWFASAERARKWVDLYVNMCLCICIGIETRMHLHSHAQFFSRSYKA